MTRWVDRVFATIWQALVAAALLCVLAPFALYLFGALPQENLGFYIQQLVSGIAIGCVYALVALGIVLIYKATETINFAQGDLLMIGAFCAYTTIAIMGLPYILGAFLAVLATLLFGFLCERTIIRPLVGEPAFSIVMVTIGLGFLLRATVGLTPGWGADTYTIPTPFTDQTINLGLAVISQNYAAIIIFTILLCLLLYLFFSKTPIGIAMQAVSENQLAASYMGIPVKNLFTLIWGISAAVAGVAGLLLAPIAFVHSQMGFIVFKAFPAAVLGGFASLPGAIIGGLTVGIAEALAGFYLPQGFKDIAAYILLLIVLILKPEGIFGNHGYKKV